MGTYRVEQTIFPWFPRPPLESAVNYRASRGVSRWKFIRWLLTCTSWGPGINVSAVKSVSSESCDTHSMLLRLFSIRHTGSGTRCGLSRAIGIVRHQSVIAVECRAATEKNSNYQQDSHNLRSYGYIEKYVISFLRFLKDFIFLLLLHHFDCWAFIYLYSINILEFLL